MHCSDHIEPGEIDYTKVGCNTCGITRTFLDIMGNCSDCSTISMRVEMQVKQFFNSSNIVYKDLKHVLLNNDLDNIHIEVL